MDANILEISIFYYCFILTPLASKIDSCNPPSDSIIILKSLIVAIFFHPKPIEIIFGKLRSIGIGGLLDFDATLPLVAIHLILLILLLEYLLFKRNSQVRIRRSSETLSHVDSGDTKVDKILRALYLMKIRASLKNALAIKNSVIFSLMFKSFERSLISKKEKKNKKIYHNSIQQIMNCKTGHGRSSVDNVNNYSLKRNFSCGFDHLPGSFIKHLDVDKNNFTD